MAQKTPAVDKELADGVKRALEAASVANDAAEEVATLSEQSRKAVQDAVAAQKRLSSIAIGALVGSVISLGLGGLIYMRSVADLREAAELQALANKASIEQIQALSKTVETAQATLTDLGVLNDQIAARIDGLADRFSGDLRGFADEAAAVQPQFASAIQKHIDDGLLQTRGEILTALAEMEAAAPKAGAADPDLIRLLTEVRDRLKAPAPAKTQTKTSAAPKPKAKPKATSGPEGAANSPFSYP